ncbi:uncharacterized protein BDV14DRAFT_138685 [Aspergillus stella-maris]|uniref:uncharacterized protein n=1 Tax=Aspergillus stella-maris TaxID=1810926 RepID=UPI003CCD4DAD
MPPKRTAEDPPAASSKRSKTGAASSSSANANAATDSEQSKPRSKRWSAVSVSRNLEGSYNEKNDYDTYECLCQPRVDGRMDDDHDEDDEDPSASASESENEDENDEPREKKDKCDTGKTCMCHKLAADNPEYPITVTAAGYQKFITQMIHTDVRCPDFFSMYVFNDFQGYGILEVLENLVLDFIEAKDNWKEQWAVCEAIPLYCLTGATTPLGMVDSADSVRAIWRLVGQMFLTMLATFESKGLLKPASEVKNLGFVMASYLPLAQDLRDSGCLEEDDSDDGAFDFSAFDSYIVAYAKKHNIKLQGVSNIEELVKEIEDAEFESFKLPARGADPWKWAAGHKAYNKEHGPNPMVDKKKMGGDSFDVTSWTSAKRKKYAFDKKDPLGKNEINAIKEGMVLQMG